MTAKKCIRFVLLVSILLVFFGCIYHLYTGKNYQVTETPGYTQNEFYVGRSYLQTAATFPEALHTQNLTANRDAATTSMPTQHPSPLQEDYHTAHKTALMSKIEAESATTAPESLPTPNILKLRLQFDPHRNDTLVFIHIQKTGGSNYARHLVTLRKNGLKLCNSSGRKRRKKVVGYSNRSQCPRDWKFPDGEPWFIAEKTLGWVCGLHASYTEFRSCFPTKFSINNRNIYFMTLLRHPVLRYISEYLHFQRGATWGVRHECGGREVTDAEMPPCYPGFYDQKPWVNVTLGVFLSCRSNWANNRQTMMLADLVSVGCFNKSLHTEEERERLLLESAKRTLRQFAYFGITEYIEESEAIFEATFGVEFDERVEQRSFSALHSAPMLQSLWRNRNVYQEVANANRLDMELYKYALELFAVRLKAIGQEIDRSKVRKAIQVLNPDAVAQTAKKFQRLKYDHL